MKSLAELVTDRGDVDHPRFGTAHPYHLAVLLAEIEFVLDEDHCHRLADVIAGDARHAIGAPGIHRDGHVRGTALLIDTRSGADDLVTGDDDTTFQQYRIAIGLKVKTAADRRLAGSLGRGPVSETAVHEAKLQSRGGAEDFLGAHGVLHAGQLHHDP